MINKQFKIIDVHIHTGYFLNQFVSGDDIAEILKEENINMGLISSVSSATIGQEKGTDEILKIVKKYPNLFRGIIWYIPYTKDNIYDLENSLKNGFVGIKIHPPLDFFMIDMDFLAPLFEIAEKYSVPILVHTEKDISNPLKFEHLVKKFSSVNLVLYHMDPYIEAIYMAEKYNNVYIETSHVPAYVVKLAIKVCSSKKILFGTDNPLGFKIKKTGKICTSDPNFKIPRNYKMIIEEYVKEGIIDEEMEDILYNNAKRIFKI